MTGKNKDWYQVAAKLLPMLFTASYMIKLKQIHMELMLKCHLATFCTICGLKSGQMTI